MAVDCSRVIKSTEMLLARLLQQCNGCGECRPDLGEWEENCDDAPIIREAQDALRKYYKGKV